MGRYLALDGERVRGVSVEVSVSAGRVDPVGVTRRNVTATLVGKFFDGHESVTIAGERSIDVKNEQVEVVAG